MKEQQAQRAALKVAGPEAAQAARAAPPGAAPQVTAHRPAPPRATTLAELAHHGGHSGAHPERAAHLSSSRAAGSSSCSEDGSSACRAGSCTDSDEHERRSRADSAACRDELDEAGTYALPPARLSRLQLCESCAAHGVRLLRPRGCATGQPASRSAPRSTQPAALGMLPSLALVPAEPQGAAAAAAVAPTSRQAAPAGGESLMAQLQAALHQGAGMQADVAAALGHSRPGHTSLAGPADAPPSSPTLSQSSTHSAAFHRLKTRRRSVALGAPADGTYAVVRVGGRAVA